MTRMDQLPLSAFIICQDEGAYIADCIESLDRCAEIVVVDSGSTDGTLEIVRSLAGKGFPIRVFEEPWRGYASQKQFALEQCTQPWCLNIDADERLDDSLKRALPKLLSAGNGVAAWKIIRRPYLIGYGYTPARTSEGYKLRLIRNGHGHYDLNQKVHEGILTRGKVRAVRTGSLLHFRPLPIGKQILKENKYSTLKADQILERQQPVRRLKLIFNPPIYFLRLYLYNGLWRCGFPGFIQAMTASIYSFLTEAKVYQGHVMRNETSKDDLKRVVKTNAR